MDLKQCMSCGSDDLDRYPDTDDGPIECCACEARHVRFGPYAPWRCADGDGVRGIQAAEANVKDAFDE